MPLSLTKMLLANPVLLSLLIHPLRMQWSEVSLWMPLLLPFLAEETVSMNTAHIQRSQSVSYAQPSRWQSAQKLYQHQTCGDGNAVCRCRCIQMNWFLCPRTRDLSLFFLVVVGCVWRELEKPKTALFLDDVIGVSSTSSIPMPSEECTMQFVLRILSILRITFDQILFLTQFPAQKSGSRRTPLTGS